MDVSIFSIQSFRVRKLERNGDYFYTVEMTDKNGGKLDFYSDDPDEFIDMFRECAKEIEHLKEAYNG